MKRKNLVIAMIVSILAFSIIPVNHVMAGETEEVEGGSDISIGGETLDPHEPEIEVAATGNEYLISESCIGMEDDGCVPYSVDSTIVFKKASTTVAKLRVDVGGDANTKKLSSKAYLMKYVNGTYKYIGKKSISSKLARQMVHHATFALEKGAKYQIKVVIVETTKQGKVITRSPIYRTLK